MIRMRRDLIELYKTFSIVQAIGDDKGDATREAFDKYRDASMPYLKRETIRAQQSVIDRLKEEVRLAPHGLFVRKVVDRSRNRSRLQELVNKQKDRPPVRWRRRKR